LKKGSQQAPFFYARPSNLNSIIVGWISDSASTKINPLQWMRCTYPPYIFERLEPYEGKLSRRVQGGGLVTALSNLIVGCAARTIFL